MSLWDFVGGAADAVLDKRKRDMAAQLQKDLEEQRRNFQMTLEQQRAERDFDKEKIRAESEMLNRKREEERYTQESAERAKQRQADEAYRNRTIAIQESNAAAAAAERGLAAKAREEEAALRRFLAGVTKNEKGEFERDPSFTPPVDKRDERRDAEDLYGMFKDTDAQSDADLIWASPAPMSVKVERLRQLFARYRSQNEG